MRGMEASSLLPKPRMVGSFRSGRVFVFALAAAIALVFFVPQSAFAKSAKTTSQATGTKKHVVKRPWAKGHGKSAKMHPHSNAKHPWAKKKR